MNLVVFSGYIGNIKYQKINDDFCVCEFSLAYSYVSNDEREITHWFNFKAYNKRAEFINKYFKKGDGIDIIGHLITESWENEVNEKRVRTVIVVDKVFFPHGKKSVKDETIVEPDIEQEEETKAPLSAINDLEKKIKKLKSGVKNLEQQNMIKDDGLPF